MRQPSFQVRYRNPASNPEVVHVDGSLLREAQGVERRRTLQDVRDLMDSISLTESVRDYGSYGYDQYKTVDRSAGQYKKTLSAKLRELSNDEGSNV